MLIDTHTHIYLDDFQDDLDLMIERAFLAGVERMYLPNIDMDSVSAMQHLAMRYPDHCFPMMGIHPCSVKPDTWEAVIEEAGTLFFKGNYCGVGEIGLDLYWDKSTYSIQSEALKIQCGWALESGKPVSLHSREATRECIDLVKPFANKGLRGVFHCFSGSAEEASEIIGMGFLLGIGGVLTYKTSTLPSFLKLVDPTFVVLETDAPYLAPVPFRGKRNEPSYLEHIAAKLAELYGLNSNEIADITSRNAMKLFNHES
jgi:TatD DNase family protein